MLNDEFRTIFPSSVKTLLSHSSFIIHHSSLLWFGDEVFGLLVDYCTAKDFVHRFYDNHPLARSERDERIGTSFNVLNQIGVQKERFAAEPREFDHVFSFAI
jgi:hypothetical protein